MVRDGNIAIAIGDKYIIDKVNYIYVQHSRKELIDRAEVHIATKYIYEGKWHNMTELIKVGDRVEIFAGYDDVLRSEFVGYVANIQKGFPLVIKCEDEMYRLKKEDVKPNSWKSTTLKSVLEYLVGSDNLMGDIPGITLKPFYIKGKISKLKVLETLKSQYGIDLYFRGDKLYAGFPYQDKSTYTQKVIYDLGYNTIDEQTKLNYRSESDVRIKVKVVSLMADNTKHEIQVGDLDGELRTLHLYNVSKATIKARAEEELKKWKFTGYSGSIAAFGEPYCEHGWIAQIRDDEDPERNSGYFIDKVSLQAGVSRGIRRTLTLGKKAEV